MDDKPTKVPSRAKTVGQTPPTKWQWVEPGVWTERMLEALERGVKGGKWFSLIDKVYREENLQSAWRKVEQNQGAAGVDQQSLEDYSRHLESNLKRLSKKLKDKNYRPQEVRRTWIPKPGRAEKRPLGIPTVEDRIVQTAIKQVIEPIFEHDFAQHSYGFRPERGCKDALRQVDRLIRQDYEWVVDADIKSYFDQIDHGKLMELVCEKISDGRVLDLIEQFLKQPIVEDGDTRQPERGTPQGGVISPLLANIYLNPLDHLMAEQGFEMVRYADDFVIVCKDRKDARRALQQVERWVEQMGLTLHPDKTHIVKAHSDEGFEFLGYHFRKGYRFPRDKAIKALKEKLRRKTRRVDGRSLQTIIEDVNLSTQGWFEYFKHSTWSPLRRLDQWLRQRLRAILRRRSGRRGIPTKLDNKRWTNDFFRNAGLFSMVAARRAIIQSLRGG
ncbi:MAG: group II intron reverse transcriptase/maturase [Persicimonas sp.]